MTNADLIVIGSGQAGLATAHIARTRGVRPLLLDAADRAGGSWPNYYNSLTLFSPARFCSLPGMPFPGDPDRYPTRDEVVAYLTAYTEHLNADVRFGHDVRSVTAHDRQFQVATSTGAVFEAPMVVAASGGFGRPYRPPIAGLDTFTGTVLHAAQYRTPDPFTGARVIVVGGGNSAVQIAVELAATSRVSIATRTPLRWQRQRLLGRDFHWWLTRTGLDTASWAPRFAPTTVPVIDDGRYQTAVRSGNPDHRRLFHRIDHDTVEWPDHPAEHVDAIILATGYRPAVDYLRGSGALDAGGNPVHRGGVSTTVPGLGYVGLERQRSLGSATLRGVGRDADHVIHRLDAEPLQRADAHKA